MGEIRFIGTTDIVITDVEPAEYRVFVSGDLNNPQMEYVVSDDSIIRAELVKDTTDRQFTVKLRATGEDGKIKVILTLSGTDEYGNKVVCDEVILNVKVTIPENSAPYFTETGRDFEGDATLFPGNAVTINSRNEAKYELAVVNINHVDEAPYFRTKDNKGLLVEAVSGNEAVVKVKVSNPTGYLPNILLSPVSAGTAYVTATLYTTELDGSNPSAAVDTFTFMVTVEEFQSAVEFKDNDYIPAEQGFHYLVSEWPYGETVTAQVWATKDTPYGDCKAVLVINGTGAMWNCHSSKEQLGNTAPWNNSRYCKYSSRIKTCVVQEGITRVEDIGGSLTELSLPSTLKEIGSYCFMSIKVSELILPEGLERIEENAFSRTTELSRVVLPDTVTYIGDAAFNWQVAFGTKTNRLKEIIIPKSVTYLGFGVFNGRDGLNVRFEEGIDTGGFGEWDYGLEPSFSP